MPDAAAATAAPAAHGHVPQRTCGHSLRSSEPLTKFTTVLQFVCTIPWGCAEILQHECTCKWGMGQSPVCGCAALQVRSKALIQYTAPFISVNLQTMAQAFGTEVGCVLFKSSLCIVFATCLGPSLHSTEATLPFLLSTAHYRRSSHHGIIGGWNHYQHRGFVFASHKAVG